MAYKEDYEAHPNHYIYACLQCGAYYAELVELANHAESDLHVRVRREKAEIDRELSTQMTERLTKIDNDIADLESKKK